MKDLKDYFALLYDMPLKPKKSTKVSIYRALGRILSSDVVCKHDIPRFDNSAMDGYALKLGYDEYEIVNSVFAGSSLSAPLRGAQAVKITTGAKIPRGAEAVVQKEHTIRNGGTLKITAKILPNQCIKNKGEDFKRGEILIPRARTIDSAGVGILASQGFEYVRVAKKVKIAIFGSGNEISPIDSKLTENNIYDINSYFLRAVLSRLPVKIYYGGVISDKPHEIANTLEWASRHYDIIITSGGASVGDKDYIHRVMDKLGAKILVDGVNIKPGKPVVFSRLRDSFVLCLPGNPIAAFFHTMFCVPILVHKFSCSTPLARYINVTNASDFALTPKTSHIVLGNVENGYFHVYNNALYGGAQISPLLKSNALAIFDDKAHAKKGDMLHVLPYNIECGENCGRMFDVLN